MATRNSASEWTDNDNIDDMIQKQIDVESWNKDMHEPLVATTVDEEIDPGLSQSLVAPGGKIPWKNGRRSFWRNQTKKRASYRTPTGRSAIRLARPSQKTDLRSKLSSLRSKSSSTQSQGLPGSRKDRKKGNYRLPADRNSISPWSSPDSLPRLVDYSANLPFSASGNRVGFPGFGLRSPSGVPDLTEKVKSLQKRIGILESTRHPSLQTFSPTIPGHIFENQTSPSFGQIVQGTCRSKQLEDRSESVLNLRSIPLDFDSMFSFSNATAGPNCSFPLGIQGLLQQKILDLNRKSLATSIGTVPSANSPSSLLNMDVSSFSNLAPLSPGHSANRRIFMITDSQGKWEGDTVFKRSFLACLPANWQLVNVHSEPGGRFGNMFSSIELFLRQAGDSDVVLLLLGNNEARDLAKGKIPPWQRIQDLLRTAASSRSTVFLSLPFSSPCFGQDRIRTTKRDPTWCVRYPCIHEERMRSFFGLYVEIMRLWADSARNLRLFDFSNMFLEPDGIASRSCFNFNSIHLSLAAVDFYAREIIRQLKMSI